MKHCMYCGGTTNQDSNKHTCTVCGKTFYDNPKAAVSVVLYSADKKRLLLGVRKHEPQAGSLDCIGGFVDIGENFEEATYRELAEESGLNKDDLLDFRYLGSSYDEYLWEGYNLPVTSAYFMAGVKDVTKLVPGDDIESIKVIDIASINEDDFAWEGMRSMVKAAVQLLAET